MSSRVFLTIVLTICFFTGPAIEGFCQDPGEPDTLRFGEWTVNISGPPCSGEAIVPLVVFNDEEVRGLNIPIKWSGPMSIDTAYFAEGRPDVFDWRVIDIDTSVFNYITFAALSYGDPMSAGTGVIAYMHFVVYDTGSAGLDTALTATNALAFNAPDATYWKPVVVPSQYHFAYCFVGDLNCDGIINVGDVIFLINYLYRSGLPPDTPGGGDINGDGNVDIGDVVYLINYLYRNGPAPLQGCAE